MSASQPSQKPPAPPTGPTGPPIGPTQARWDALSPAAQQRLGDELLGAMQEFEEANLSPESSEHHDAKEEILNTLRDFYGGSGRGVFIGTECAVFYPDEPGFVPDLIAVMDVPTHPRDSWIVATERRGLDVVFEVHFKGSWKKDYVANVRRYARLGILEYFILDLRSQSLTAYRLPPGGNEYEQVRVRSGRVRSERLGLELGVRRGRLRFFVQGAPVQTPAERLAEFADIAEQAQARADEEKARAEQEQARAEQEQARAERSLAGLRGVLFVLLARQGVALSEAQAALIQGCTDPALLTRWCERAVAGGATTMILGDD